MRRESHVRFREGVGVQFPRATRPVDPRPKSFFSFPTAPAASGDFKEQRLAFRGNQGLVPCARQRQDIAGREGVVLAVVGNPSGTSHDSKRTVLPGDAQQLAREQHEAERMVLLGFGGRKIELLKGQRHLVAGHGKPPFMEVGPVHRLFACVRERLGDLTLER